MAAIHLRMDAAVTLLAIVEHGSFSRAAKALGLSQSTASRHVAELEARAGRPLFVRRGARVEPTEAARALLASAEAAARAAQDFTRRLGALSEQARGRVRVTAPPELVTHLLAPRLGVLLAAHPALEVELLGAHAVLDVLGGEVDVSLRVAAPAEADVVRRRVGTVRYRVYGTRAALQRAARRWVTYAPPLDRLPEAEWVAAHAAPDAIVARLSPPAAVVEACAAGVGVSLLPEALAARHRGLRAEGDGVLTRPLYALAHRDLARAPRVRAVLEWVAAAVGESLAP